MIPITLRTRAEYALPLEYVVSLKDNGCPPGSIGGETVLRQPFTRLHSSLQRLQLLTAITAAYSRLHSDWFVPPAARPGVSETHCLTQKRNPRTAVPRASS